MTGFGPDARFGPDNVTYEEAHRREWNRIHPGKPVPPIGRNRKAIMPGIETEIPGSPVSRPARSRYNKHLRSNPSIKEEKVAPRTKPAAPVEPEEAEEADLTAYADKTVTPAAQAFAEWIADETGYEVDERSVYMAMSLRRKFQADSATRTRIAEIREERKPAKAEPEEKEDTPKPRRGAATNVKSTSTTAKAPARSRATTAKPTAPARGRSRGGAAKPAAAAAASGEAPF